MVKILFPNGGQDGALAIYEKISVDMELYDLINDRNETKNISDQHPKVVEQLLVKADSIRQILGDKVVGVEGMEVRPLVDIATLRK